MKTWIFSDLHLEDTPLPVDFAIPEADICIAAGDINSHGGVRSLTWLNDVIAPHMPVLFTPGNHEFYDASIVEGRAEMRKLAATMPNVTLLDDSSIEINGVLFAGATLWTDFRLFGNPKLAGSIAHDRQTGMRDYKYIKYQRNPWQRFTPLMASTLHGRSKNFLEKALRESDAETKVIISHHAPTPQSLAEDKRNDLISAAYASNMEDFIEEVGADMWVHGHIHLHHRYQIGKTLMLSNTRGYGSETETGFDPGLVIDLQSLKPGNALSSSL